MNEHRDQFEIDVMCNALDLSPSGYHAWRKRPTSPRQARGRELIEQIRQSHALSRGTYGSPRVHVDLKEKGVSVCENTVAKYMRVAGIRSKITARRFRLITTDSRHDHPVADNLLERNFTAERPDTKWCCDITYVPTDEGFLYLAAVIDCCSRKIIGWAMADHLRAELCLDALAMAIERRRPPAGPPACCTTATAACSTPAKRTARSWSVMAWWRA